jgi:GxxExxY protein
MVTKKYLDELTYEVIGSAIAVHKFLGRGLLESLYRQCLIEELRHRKINFQTELKIPVKYRGKYLDIDFRCDLYIENAIIVELKSVHDMHSVFDAQLLTYMKLLQCPKGILINFNCSNIFKEGQKTFVNEYFSKLPDN